MDAQQPLSQHLRLEVGNGYLQFLHGLACDRASDAASGCAAVAYDSATRLAPGNYWANLFHGFLHLRQGDFHSAAARFADAAQDEDADWEALYGLGAAAYFGGDLELAELAAERALALAPERADVLRLTAMVRAAAGETGALDQARAYATLAPAAESRRLHRRVEHLLRTAAYEAPQRPLPPATTGDAAAAVPSSPDGNQIVVDVSIVLSSLVKNERRGVNLLDGLRLQYGYDYSREAVRTQGGAAPGQTVTRTILSQIGVPQLDYNLNLFNDASQHYSVLARPSLTAHLARESSFFAGRTLTVEVSGVNLGDLQPIDVGVWLKVTPEKIGATHTTVKVSAERSFLSSDEIGTFEQSLTTFKQAVSATAELEFGQTLVLSALSETVRDSLKSKVPVLGDIPLLNTFTRRRDTLEREESLLILVTPQRPLSAALPLTTSRPPTIQRLLRWWQATADPNSNLDHVIERLERSRLFRGAERADLATRLPHEAELAQRALDDMAALLRP